MCGSPEVICGEVSGSVQTGEQGESIALGEPELDLAILVTTEVKTGFVYCTGVLCVLYKCTDSTVQVYSNLMMMLGESPESWSHSPPCIGHSRLKNKHEGNYNIQVTRDSFKSRILKEDI